MAGITTNRIAEALEHDRPVYGINVLSTAPTVVEALADIGLDYVWLDLEHVGPSPYDSEAVAELVRAAELADLEPLVRVPEADQKMINEVVDAGVRTVLVPKVESADEIRRAVSAARFEYDGGPGDRGAPLARSTGWRSADPGFPAAADETVMVGAMIETEAAVAAIDEILSVPELGFAFVGPGDLSVSLGRPLESDHETVAEAVADVEHAADRHDIPLGRIATAPEEIDAAVADGYRVLRVGVDTVAVAETVKRRLADLESAERQE